MSLTRVFRIMTVVVEILAASVLVPSPHLLAFQQESTLSALPPRSSDPTSHFETVNGRAVLFVDGLPHTVLTEDIAWTELTSFSIDRDFEGGRITVSGQDGGQAIIIRVNAREYLAVGYRSRVSIWDEKADACAPKGRRYHEFESAEIR